MRILHTECGKQWGGQELRTLVEVEQANRDGHQAWAAVNEEGRMAEFATQRGTPHFRVSMKSSTDPRGFAQLAQIIRREKPDIIACHNARDFYLCWPWRALGIPVLRYRHISEPVKATFSRSFAYKTGANAVIATAESIKQGLVSHNGVRPERIHVIGEGVELEAFGIGPGARPIDGARIRAEHGWTEDEIVIGSVGMVRADKGFDVLLRAAALLRDQHANLRWMIVGGPTRDGAYLRQMQQLARDLGLAERVAFTGWREDVPEHMAALDIFVLASTGVEGQSRVIPEAFALSKPVIGTRLGGIPELVEHEQTGLLVAPKSPEDLAAAVERYLRDPALKAKCAAASHQLAITKLDLRARMRETYAVYERIIGC